eukprot:CAMPEP_0204364754 /NCGR_PEP_ID=MMETSP0469-20131031/41389_1 /ASSEMBLY_ACC=CAM_ASM_000384 /TAXON_ID=2969 /ORGANISM="Oxyrrhis marina" /LENGTH=32 /DNA_ID= /DNA_START= /DNA_END= /DNA_ORIENTATION=
MADSVSLPIVSQAIAAGLHKVGFMLRAQINER